MRDEEILLSLGKTLSSSDLPDSDSRWIADNIGMDAAIKMCLQFSGVQIYIPKSTEVRLKRLYVERNFTGNNARSLALKLGVAERTIYQWLNEPKVKPNVEQTDLFKPA
jgi:Mor family transcriptional regulator